jgi:glycine/D-amino acid oxidase-like deaminating enzyme
MTDPALARGAREPRGPVVVVGGGVIGLCIAYYLTRAGVPVDVVERHEVGFGASWGNAGWVCESHSAPIPAPHVMSYALRSLGRPESPLYLRPRIDPRLAAWLFQFWRSTSRRRFLSAYEAVADLNRTTLDRYDELSRAGVATGLRRVGMVHAFLSREAADEQHQLQAFMAPGRYDMGDGIVGPGRAADLDPALLGSVQAAYLVPGEAVVEPDQLTAALAKAITEQGGLIHEGVTVTGFRHRGAKVAAVQTSAGAFDSSSVVVAAGTWSARLTEQLGFRLRLQTGKGYSFSVRLDPAPTHALYLGDHKIAVTPMGERTRIAGTIEISGNNRDLDWRRIVAIALGTRHYLGRWFEDPDDLATRILEPWVGGRPLLPDGLPVIDRLPGTDNAYVATGHGMLGVTLAPATGRALADQIVSGRRPPILEPFRAR